MLRIALRVRLRFRSAQDDTEGVRRKILTKTIPPSRYRVPPPFAQRRRRVAFASNEVQYKIYKKAFSSGRRC